MCAPIFLSWRYQNYRFKSVLNSRSTQLLSLKIIYVQPKGYYNYDKMYQYKLFSHKNAEIALLTTCHNEQSFLKQFMRLTDILIL